MTATTSRPPHRTGTSKGALDCGEVDRGMTRPIALLTRPPATTPGPKLGTLRGQIRYHPGWNEPMTDEEFEEFTGGKL